MMLDIAVVLRHLCFQCPLKPHASGNGDSSEDDEATGSEWLYIEEPVGYFVPTMQKRRRFLQLDQVLHLLHYGNFKHAMRLHDISLVTSVEETDTFGVMTWWMTVQDPSTLQVWVVHFPSRHRLLAWVQLLRSVLHGTNSRAIVGELVFMDAQKAAPSCLLPVADTILPVP
ncbi:hypothetical protein BBJ28_00021884 [Nothophytophthora sp. Chile5]|nr:hypothetical protein BBJ28_00021884 [Nothophytophthora sp. Chile5]